MTASTQTHCLLTCMVPKLFTWLQMLEMCLFWNWINKMYQEFLLFFFHYQNRNACPWVLATVSNFASQTLKRLAFCEFACVKSEPCTCIRVRTFGVIWIRISGPRSVWIMVHQKNRWIHDHSGLVGFFDAPWSRQILDHWSTDPVPDHPKGTHLK